MGDDISFTVLLSRLLIWNFEILDDLFTISYYLLYKKKLSTEK